MLRFNRMVGAPDIHANCVILRVTYQWQRGQRTSRPYCAMAHTVVYLLTYLLLGLAPANLPTKPTYGRRAFSVAGPMGWNSMDSISIKSLWRSNGFSKMAAVRHLDFLKLNFNGRTAVEGSLFASPYQIS